MEIIQVAKWIEENLFWPYFLAGKGKKNIVFLKFMTYDQRLIHKRYKEQAQRSSSQC